MSVHAVFRCGLLLIGFVLGAVGVAEAKIPPSQASARTVPDAMDTNALSEYPNHSLTPPAQEACETTKTLTLNFGPLHFQEILKSTLRTCHS